MHDGGKDNITTSDYIHLLARAADRDPGARIVESKAKQTMIASSKAVCGFSDRKGRHG